MERTELVIVSGFALALDRRYHAETHMWVLLTEPDRARIGMDPLGIETSGTLAQLSFDPVGSELTAGRPFGQLEAAKFVGPLISPVSGTVLAVNDAAAFDAGLTERDPYGSGWLIEASLSDATGELQPLLENAAEITTWFTAKIADYRRMGVIAQ
jgi:glycine cleavage system H protein